MTPVEMGSTHRQVPAHRLRGGTTERDEPLLVALPQHADDPLLQVDARAVETDGFGHAQARRRRGARRARDPEVRAGPIPTPPRSGARTPRATAIAGSCAGDAAGVSSAAGFSDRAPITTRCRKYVRTAAILRAIVVAARPSARICAAQRSRSSRVASPAGPSRNVLSAARSRLYASTVLASVARRAATASSTAPVPRQARLSSSWSAAAVPPEDVGRHAEQENRPRAPRGPRSTQPHPSRTRRDRGGSACPSTGNATCPRRRTRRGIVRRTRSRRQPSRSPPPRRSSSVATAPQRRARGTRRRVPGVASKAPTSSATTTAPASRNANARADRVTHVLHVLDLAAR